MRDLVTTDDPVLLNFIQALLREAGIMAVVFDSNMSAVRGALGIVQHRIAVPEESWIAACRLLEEADLGQWIVE
jgi:DNA-binding response OmpR family regulator